MLFYLFVSLLKTGFHTIILKLTAIFLSQSSECWDHMHEPPYPDYMLYFLKIVLIYSFLCLCVYLLASTHNCVWAYTHMWLHICGGQLSCRPQELNQTIKTGSYVLLPAGPSAPHVVLKLVDLFLVILKTYYMGVCPFAI